MQDLFKIAGLIMSASIVLQVFASGLGTTWHEANYLFRHPRLLWNSILARNVLVPILAVLLIKAFSLHQAVAVTLGVLAVTPVPPLIHLKQVNAGARSSYAIALLFSQAILAIGLVPLAVQFMNWSLGSQAHFSPRQVAAVVGQTILVPLITGMLAAQLIPALKSVAPALAKIGSVLLIVGALPMLLLAWNSLATLSGNGTLLALAIFVIAATLIGHYLGGPLSTDRTDLATATSSRHPGLAIGIARANFPEQATLVAGLVIVYLLVRTILSIPYMRHRTVRALPHGR